MRFSPDKTTDKTTDKTADKISLTARCCLLLLLVFLTACARPLVGKVRIPAEPVRAAENWDRFAAVARQNETLAGPFRLNGTLYYTGKEDSQRVNVYFWGNGDKNAPLPLRLDVLVGTGGIVAQVGEDKRGLFVYMAREKRVYYSMDKTLLAFDFPLPFALKDVAFLIAGRFAELFAPGGTPDVRPEAVKSIGNKVIYAIPDSALGGQVTIAEDGLPIAWDDGEVNGWSLRIDYWPDSTRPEPHKVYIRHGGGRQATLIVRELARPDVPFTPQQLELVLPPGTFLAPLVDSR